MIDGQRCYTDWTHGMACTGGKWGGSAIWCQATVDFGKTVTIDTVVMFHFREQDYPNTYKIQYWQNSAWVDVFSTTEGRKYLKWNYTQLTAAGWTGCCGQPSENTFTPVTTSRLRFTINNGDIEHGWFYELEAYCTSCNTQCAIATNCNGHATTVSGNLVSGCTCTCAPGYTGSSCNACATNYTGYPTCTAAPCTTATNCNGHTTAVSGNLVSGCTCTCATGYTGSSCNACATNYTGYPTCTVSRGGILGNVPVLAQPPGNLAYNPTCSGYPSISLSDKGWGGGATPCDMIDGQRCYTDWTHGMACTGGKWGGSAIWCQATVDFGKTVTIDTVVMFHFREQDYPNTYKIQYWQNSAWVDVFSTTEGRKYLKWNYTQLTAAAGWTGCCGQPSENTFTPVTTSRLRFTINNGDIEHGWFYELEAYCTSCNTQCAIATNCNGHATTVSGNLVSGCTCTCAPGYTGSSCNACATNYTGYPTCTAAPCTTATNCNGHTTAVSGNLVSGCTCTCATGYTGSSCNACATNYTGYPTCTVSRGGILGNVPVLAQPPGNLAYNPTCSGYPSISLSDKGWGGGATPCDMIDGQRCYTDWTHGMACTGGKWGGSAIWCQATVDFGKTVTIDTVVMFHFREQDYPNTYKIQYWQNSAWVDVFSTTEGRKYLKWNYTQLTAAGWTGCCGQPSENTFTPVTTSRLRFTINNGDIEHGWFYELEAYCTSCNTRGAIATRAATLNAQSRQTAMATQLP